MAQSHFMTRRSLWAALLFLCVAPTSHASAAPGGRSILFDLQPSTVQQRLEDFAWIVSNFEEFYAPLAYKEERWNFSWEALKQEYGERIRRPTMDHRQFAQTMQEFVAHVHDAHTSLTTWREATMDGRDLRVATLGFHTGRLVRAGHSSVVVRAVLANFFPWEAPVRVGDQIIAIDGRPVETIIKEDLQPAHTTGREDSDATLLARSLTFRVSTQYPIRPTGGARVTVRRDDKIFDVHLDWTDVSLQDIYRAEREANDDASSAPAVMAQSKVIGRTQDNRWIVQIDGKPVWRHLVQAEQSTIPDVEHQYALQSDVAFYNAVGRPMDEAALNRPTSPFVVDGLNFRMFKTGHGLAAIYRVEDFMYSRLRCGPPVMVDESISFSLCDELSGEDYSKAFGKLASMGVTDLILDLRGNGGGMLKFSDNLLRAFARNGIAAQKATVRVNEMWLGEFIALATSDYAPLAARAIYRAQEKILREDIAAAKRLSSPVYIQGMATLGANALVPDLATYVLVDELCASACDLFAASMQDNKLATILGRQSMGAGGNVIRIGQSPHEKLSLTQTASLIYRADGSFVENNGVAPDVVIPSNLEPEVWDMVAKVLEGSTSRQE